MKRFFITLILYCLLGPGLYAQCNSGLSINGQYGTMPAQADAQINIDVSNSSVTSGQTLSYKAGESINLNQTFVANEGSTVLMEVSRESKYKIGAWYHSAFYLDAYWADRNKGYTIKDRYPTNIPDLGVTPSYRKIADIWNGVRNVALNDQFYAGKIPEMTTEPNYNLAHKPLLGFYDISDQRVIDKQIEMAASRGLSFFGFYNYYQENGLEGYSDRVVNRFKSSPKKNLLKYMINLYAPSSVSGNLTTFISNLTTTVLNQLSISNGSSTLDPSCLTNANGQPIIGISAGFFFNNMTEADFNNVAQSLRTNVQSRFGVVPIILICTDSGDNGRAKSLMQNGTWLYDGYLGFQHLLPTQGNTNGDDYGSLASSTWSTPPGPVVSSIYSINNSLVSSIPSYVPQKYNVPSISVGFDSRPWIPIPITGQAYAQYYFKNTSPTAFSTFLLTYKTYMDATPATNNMLMCYAWNEWGESGILEPSEANQYQYLDAIKSTFCMRGQAVNPDLTGFSTTYDQWKSSKNWGSYSSLNNYADDPDNDGLQNIFEYAFDLNPIIANTYSNANSLPYYNYNAGSGYVTLKYNRDFKKNDLIYFVEKSEAFSDIGSEWDWYIYDESDWGHENNQNWANYVTTNGTIETRLCRPNEKSRGDGNNDNLIKRMRLVIAMLKPDRAVNEPVERFFFPPENKPTYRIAASDSQKQEAVIFPNPSATGLFNITLSDKSEAQVSVYNTLGQKVKSVFTQTDNTAQLDLSKEALGIYLVQVTQNGNTNSYKVVSNK